jgi:hypothetical protein
MKKKKYFIIWIEGLEYRDGEKVKTLTDTGVSYTTKMTEAMRIRECDIHHMKDYMKRHGFASWCINETGSRTFIPTSYAPKGTLYKFPQI